MNRSQHQADRPVSRRILIRNCVAGTVFMNACELADAGHEAQGQPPLYICPRGLVGATAEPEIWYYYGAECPSPIQYYGMTYPSELTDILECPPPDGIGNPANCQSYLAALAARKQLPLAMPSNSHSRHHIFWPKNGVYPPVDGLAKVYPHDFELTRLGPYVVKPVRGENYQLTIKGRPGAARIFKIEVKLPNRPKDPLRIGVGREITGVDPDTLPRFDWEANFNLKYYIGYRRSDDHYFHILTKT